MDKIQKIAEDVKEHPEVSLRLVKRFLPLFIMLLMAGLLWLYFTYSDCTSQHCSIKQDQSLSTKVDSIPLDREGMAAAKIWSETLGKNVRIDLPNGQNISVPESGFENSLLDYLKGNCPGDMKTHWFNCDRLLFKSGSKELNSVSLEQIKDLAELMKSFPSSVFKIGGYTDNTGDVLTNQKLSEERASEVMEALIQYGVSAHNLSSEGYGSKFPICSDNDTEECKAKNRRIAISVEKCK